MRHEHTVFLQQRVVALRRERKNGSVAKRLKPNHSIDAAMRGWCGLDAKMQLGAILCAESCGKQDECCGEPAAEP
jgi:hypothetical protein